MYARTEPRLRVAAHLVRSQLIADPLDPCEARQLIQTLDTVGNALAKVAPLYLQDPATGAARQLTEAELDGAQARNGATRLVLRDGRTLSGVSIRRTDLRQAIAILKAIGVQGLLPRRQVEGPRPPAPDAAGAALAGMDEIERLLRPPLVPAQVQRANALLLSIARHAAHGRVANLAMLLMSAVHDALDKADDREIAVLTARLRAALEESSVSAT